MRALLARAPCLLLLLLLGCQSQCVLDDDVRLFAGDRARDCGSVDLGGNRDEIDACVAEAFAAEQAFIARYVARGVDSQLVTAVARNQSGSVKFFQWDSAPCGGPGCDPVTDVQACNGPSLSSELGEDPDALPISCESQGLAQRVCG